MTNRRRQVARWTLTVMNYNSEVDYIKYFRHEQYRVKRVVIGFETSTTRGSDPL